MIHVTRYRVYPSREIQNIVFENFDICTAVRNWCLDNKIFDVRVLPVLKRDNEDLKRVHSNVLQNMIFQMEENVRGLSVAKIQGVKVGNLRYKTVRSLIYEGTGFRVVGKILMLGKIGEIPIVITRPIPGIIKQVVLKFTKTHKWFVSIISKTPDEPIIRDGTRTVGIDMNLVNFSTDTDGRVFEHPHNVKRAAQQLGRAQRKMSRKIKGSNNRRKQRLKVAKIYEKVESRRDDFLHKWSNYYVQRYDRIAIEKLNIKEMLEGRKFHGMNRVTLDAAWGKAREFLTHKAERAGCQFVAVDPSYTSQDCSRCGTRVPKGLSERKHMCLFCGYNTDRDLNAAQNIKNKAFYVGWGTPEFTPIEIGTSTKVIKS